MAQAKFQPTEASVEDYLAARATTPQQRADCDRLVALCERITRHPPKMWGPSIVGFGLYRYRYESGRTGEACLAAFAVRGKEIVVYIDVESPTQQALLARVGPHRMGKVCLYIKRLADLDFAVLEALVAGSVAETRQRHGEAAA